MHGISPLKKWLIENHLFTREKNYTHLLLDGGKLIIPESRMNEFLNYYTNDFINNHRNYICEGKTNIFRFHADLDFFQEEELEINELLTYISTIQSVLKELFVDKIRTTKNNKNNKLKLYVCLTETGIKEKYGNIYKKIGVHLIWPNIYIDTEKSLIIRRLIITKFKNLYGERDKHNSWEDVVDESVYRQNGLRMIGSAKLYKCKDCRDNIRNKTNCQTCFGKGKIDEGRIYLPTYLFLDENIKNIEDLRLKNNKTYTHKQFYQYIKETSIRNFNNIETPLIKELPSWIQDNIKDYNNFPKIKNTRTKKSRKNIRQSENSIFNNSDIFNTSINNISDENNLNSCQNDTNQIISDFNIVNNVNDSEINSKIRNIPNTKIRYSWCIEDENAKLIINYIKAKFPKYKEEPFREIYLCGTNSSPFYIVSTNSHYCMNVCREHTSNHIYFIIDKNNIYQKCFSTNNSPDQKYGLCKDYRSQPSQINSYYKTYLFKKMIEDADENIELSPMSESSLSSVSSSISSISSDSNSYIESPISSIISSNPDTIKNNKNTANNNIQNRINNKSINKNKNKKNKNTSNYQNLNQNINIKTKYNKNKIENFLLELEDDMKQNGIFEIGIIK